MPNGEQVADPHFASNGEPYPMGRTKAEQTVVFNEQYLTSNPKPHTDELGPVFPKEPFSVVEKKDSDE